ncbi:hypothetical protein QN277_007231 [Acacia crassicarpa]|uniref:Uncharacterized protein n=1 Tax=Acacia crassicarpa TaxID=499986 RepID=A0AAE1IUB2_9FABA|nr:hypothetical protein QN277_007231 [Acacia crassicarpa]
MLDSLVPNETNSPSSSSSTSFALIPSLNSLKIKLPSFIPRPFNVRFQEESSFSESSLSQVENNKSLLTEQDLEHLRKLVEEKDGGPAWVQMMDRSTTRMSYKAWRRVLEFPFFCSDREYVIGRRIWESEQSYYCVTKISCFAPHYTDLQMISCSMRIREQSCKFS